MNKIRAILAVSLLLLSTAACDNIDDPINLGPAVYGTVLEAGTNQAIDGATVSIANRQATSAANGNYYLADVASGTHTLRVTKPGYAEYSVEVTVDGGMVQKNVHLTK